MAELVPAVFVTVTSPVTADAGTFTFICVSDQVSDFCCLCRKHLSPFGKVIKLVDALEEAKAVPVIVTRFDGDVLEPDAGFGVIDAILGTRMIVSELTK